MKKGGPICRNPDTLSSTSGTWRKAATSIAKWWDCARSEGSNDAPGPLQGKRIGLYHVGWKVGNNLGDLRKAKQRVEAFGTVIDDLADHTVTQSLYLRDLDGNEVELYIDNPGGWMRRSRR